MKRSKIQIFISANKRPFSGVDSQLYTKGNYPAMSQKWRLPTRYISEEVIVCETIYQRHGNGHRRTAFRTSVHPYDRIPMVFDSCRVRLDCDINEGGNEMNVNIKRLSPDAQTPTYAHATDAGFDLVAAADVIIEPGETACVPTGLAFEIPEGYEMQTRPDPALR